MTGREDPPSLKDLQGRLEAARSRQQDRRGADDRGRSPISTSGLGFGLRIAVDLLAGLAIGVGLGLVLDHWLGTAPLMMVVFLFVGSAAGMLNVYRAATGRGFAVGYPKETDRPAKPGEAPPAGEGQAGGAAREGGAADEDRGTKS